MTKRSGRNVLVVLALVVTLGLRPVGASDAAPLDPSFGAGGVATAPLPGEASQKEVSIVDLAAAPDGTTWGRSRAWPDRAISAPSG